MSESDSQRWQALCSRFGRAGAAPALWTMLEAMYTYPARFYHSMAHARDVVDKLSKYGGAQRPDECELALWLHDCVYVPAAKDNEERSAAVAEVFCRELGLDAAATARVREMIMATRHMGLPQPPDAGLVADVDLSSIGSDPATYARGSELIKREFAVVPEAAFRAGRAEFLKGILGRARIFYTDAFNAEFDGPARRNMLGELKALGEVP